MPATVWPHHRWNMETELATTEPIELKKLSQKHKDVASLVAQGVSRQLIAEVIGITPEYVTWLQRQSLFKEYIKEMSEAVSTQLEAMFSKSVDVIAGAMQHGSIDEQLKGAKLQLEATGRVGRFQTQAPVGSGVDRLEQLSERLLGLLQRQRGVIHEAEDAEVIHSTEDRKRLPQPQAGAQ